MPALEDLRQQWVNDDVAVQVVISFKLLAKEALFNQVQYTISFF
jgi:hypothetical protein